MKTRAMTAAATLLATSLTLALPAYSADVSVLPAEKSQGSVRYRSGGVDLNEAEAFKQTAAKYPLELLFAQKATPRDEYLAGIKVTIRDRSDKTVLDVTSEGPFLLVDLPPGLYRIEADNDGALKRQTVDVQRGKHARVVLLWNTSDSAAR